MKITKRDVSIASGALAIALLVGMGLTAFVGANSQPHDYLPIKGTITVSVNGHQVYSGDTIMLLNYDYVICKVFNDTTACNTAGAYFGSGGVNNCQYFGNNGHARNNLWGGSLCSEVGLELSTDPTAPTNTFPYCTSALSGSGLSPLKATTTHAGGTNTVVLSGTWTFSGTSQSNIQKVCLALWNDQANAFNIPTGGNILAADTFPAQTLTTSQTLTLQWTLSF